jgi:mannose-6-phosphate isomerase-like protein (cupin superfamily)
MMEVIRYEEVPDAPNPHGVSAKVLHETEHEQTVVVTLQPNEALKLHITPVDAFFFILQGEGSVQIGDEQGRVSAGSMIISPARIPHRLWNDGNETFRFLVVKTPRPDEPAKIL